MHSKHFGFLILFPFLCAACFQVSMCPLYGQDTDEKKQDDEKISIEGTWNFKTGHKAGAESAEQSLAVAVIVDGDSFTIPVSEEMEFVMNYELDTSTDPISVDMTMNMGGTESKGVGILKLDGDTMTLCYDPTGAKRPAEFESTEENGCNLFVMTKAETAAFDSAAMKGTWSVSKGVRAGAEVPAERMEPDIVITGDRITIPTPDEDFVMSYELGATDEATEIDITILEGPGEGKALGLVKKDGDQLVLIYDSTGENRPESFESTEENGFFMFTLDAVED